MNASNVNAKGVKNSHIGLKLDQGEIYNHQHILVESVKNINNVRIFL